MQQFDNYEAEIINAYENDELQSIATEAELIKIKAAAHATTIRDRYIKIRLSSNDLFDIQAKALEEGISYQMLISNILHKYVTGRLTEYHLTNTKFLP